MLLYELPHLFRLGFFPVHRHLSLPQSSSASRFTAAHAEFFILCQSADRPERQGKSLRFAPEAICLRQGHGIFFVPSNISAKV